MKKVGFLLLIILVISVGSTIGFVGISSLQNNNPWNGMSCEEMFEFAMNPEHQKLTMEQHMEFHKKYEPCLQKP